MLDEFTYIPKGTCSRALNFAIEDGKIVSFEAIGGCSGNLRGIGRLLKGRDIDEVIEVLEGTTCGMKPTSCPDQIAQALKAYKEKYGR